MALGNEADAAAEPDLGGVLVVIENFNPTEVAPLFSCGCMGER